MSDANKRLLRLPPKDLMYRVLLERSEQIKSGIDERRRTLQSVLDNASANVEAKRERSPREWRDECERLRMWVNDLQSGMYINCVYCGHRYGPDPGTPVAMADVLREHVEQCPEHPLAQLRATVVEFLNGLRVNCTPLERAVGWEQDHEHY